MLKGKISADVAPLLFGDASCSREKVEVRLSQQESAGIVLKTLKTRTKAECKCFPSNSYSWKQPKCLPQRRYQTLVEVYDRWKSIRRKLLSPDKFVPLENISQNCHQGLFHHSHISQVSGRYPHPDSHRLSRRSRTYWLALLLKRQTFRKYAIAIGDKYQCVKESNSKAKHWWLWCWESSRCWESWGKPLIDGTNLQSRQSLSQLCTQYIFIHSWPCDQNCLEIPITKALLCCQF